MIRRWLALAAFVLAAPASAQAPDPIGAVLANAKFDGLAMVASADRVLWQPPLIACNAPRGMACIVAQPDQRRWPWASVSKQMLAILTMQQVDSGRIALDVPADRYLPALKKGKTAPTIRELLQHRSGLPNPDDTAPGANGFPTFFTDGRDELTWCLHKRKAPGGNWRYNNCDSIVLGALLERVTGKPLATLFDTGIAKPLRLDAAAYVDWGLDDRFRPAVTFTWGPTLTADERSVLVRFGAAGGLAGSARDLLAIDRALMAGKLMSPAARDAMWAGDPKLGYMALAQWVFDARLKGCAAPVRIVERRGGIGRFQVRNIILPARDRIVILFTTDGDYDFGEIWQGKGLSYDLLSAAACP